MLEIDDSTIELLPTIIQFVLVSFLCTNVHRYRESGIYDQPIERTVYHILFDVVNSLLPLIIV